MATVHLAAMLGIKPNIPGGVAYLDESDVQYICGRNIVRYDADSRCQRIVQGSPESVGITAVATSNTKSKMTAYAEYFSDRSPVIVIYDWAQRKRRRVIAGPELGRAPVTQLSFTCDGKAIVAQTGAPEWNLHYIGIDKPGPGGVGGASAIGGTATIGGPLGGRTPIVTLKNVTQPAKPVASVDCHPSDPSLVAVCGRGFLRLLRLVEDTLRTVQVNLRREAGHFTTQCWLPEDRLVLGTLGGDVWMLEGTEFKRVLTDPPPPPPGAAPASPAGGGAGGGGMTTTVTAMMAATGIGGKYVSSIVHFSKGFIVGGDGATIRIFEKAEDPRLFYKLTKTLTINDETSRITGVAVSSNDEELACVCASGQIYGFRLSTYELAKPTDILFRPLVAMFHAPPPTPSITAGGQWAAVGGSGAGVGMDGDGAGGDASGAGGTTGGASAALAAATLSGPGRRGSFVLGATGSVGSIAGGANATGNPMAGTLISTVSNPAELLAQANHGITGIDTCVRRPIFVTAGADRTVRLWGYLPGGGAEGSDHAVSAVALPHAGDGAGAAGGAGGVGGAAGGGFAYTPTCEFVHRFPERPTTVAMHPSGFLMLVGFESNLLLMSVLMNTLRQVREVPIRTCPLVRFSHSGAMFAAINGNTVVVYHTYTCVQVAACRAHADKVVSFAWTRDDRHIVSVAKDGHVCRFAVVVPNAVSATGSAAAAAAAGTAAVGSAAGGTPMATGSAAALAGGGTTSSSPLAMVGKPLNIYEIRDLTPLAITTGNADNGRDVVVSGVISRGGAMLPVLRFIDLTTLSARDAVKSDPPQGSTTVRALLAAPQYKLLLSGLGTPLDRVSKALSGSMGLSAAGGLLGSPAAMVPPTPSASSAAATAGVGGGSMTLGGLGGSGVGFFSPSGGLPSLGSSLSPAASGMIVDGTASGAASVIGGAGGSIAAGSTAAGVGAGAAAAASAPPDTTGIVRVYPKLPMGPEYTDIVCHTGPIAHFAPTHDGRLVITAGTDGIICILACTDTRPKSSGGLGAGVSLGATGSAAAAGAGGGGAGGDSERWVGSYTDEVLVTRSDLELVRKEKHDLETRVQEIVQTNRYNERYKEMTHAEKIRDIEARFEDELAAGQARYEALRLAKEEAEHRLDEQLAEMEVAQARELEDLESTYRAKIAGEMERYDALVSEREIMNEEFDAANAQLVKEHAEAIESLKHRYDAAIAAEQVAAAGLEEDKRTLQGQFASLADDIELDVDAEMEGMRARFERKLQSEAKNTLLLQGENGFWKHKFVKANKEMSEKKEELSGLVEKEKELHEAIAALQKDVAGHKKEIRERDETVLDKEARIYDLKKKNQELEKFKFVLNYKIQELKRQIMPRKREIADLREQMKEMELELLQYHKSNAALDLMITELKLKRDGMHREVQRLAAESGGKASELDKIARDVGAVAAVADDAKALRGAMTRLYRKYLHGETTAAAITSAGMPSGVDVADVQLELARQRNYLERSIGSLRVKMSNDSAGARIDHARLMRENTVLTQDINDLRRELRYLQGEFAKDVTPAAGPTSPVGGATVGSAAATAGRPAAASLSLRTPPLSPPGGIDISAIDIAQAAAELGLDDDDADVTPPTSDAENGGRSRHAAAGVALSTVAGPRDALDAHLRTDSVKAGASLGGTATATVVLAPGAVPNRGGTGLTKRTTAAFGVVTRPEGAAALISASGGTAAGGTRALGASGGVASLPRGLSLSAAGAEALRSKLATLKLTLPASMAATQSAL